MLKKASSVVLASLKTSTYQIKPAGGKVTIRSHVIEASGSSKAWYVPPRHSLLRPPTGKARVSARAGWAGEKAAFLTILHSHSHFVVALPS
jgi:hypothetical protein